MIQLYPYQKTGVQFLASRRHALLADEMGLGKTAQAITAAKELNLKNILVVCPASVCVNWQREFWKFDQRTSEITKPLNSPILIMSFEGVSRYLPELVKRQWDLVIVDESHYLKSEDSARTKAVLGSHGVLHHTKRMWLLSGTPAPNHAGELWPMLFTFGMTKLSYDGFTARYCNSFHAGGNKYSRVQITGSNTKHTPELKKILKRFALRRLKKDVLPQLPPISHHIHYLENRIGVGDDEDIFAMYPELKEKMKKELERLKERLNFDANPSDAKLLSTLMLMSQSVSSVRRYHGLKKAKPVATLIREELQLQLYKKIVIFGIHTDVLKAIAHHLKDKGVVLFTGQTPPEERQRAIDSFQTDDSVRVFIGNINAAGKGITLTASNQVFFAEQDWVPGNNAQAADRCHRIGQSLPVTVRHACISGSLDDRITAILTRKIREIATFI